MKFSTHPPNRPNCPRKECQTFFRMKIKENAFGVREPFLRYNKDEILIGLNALKIYNPKKKISQAKDIYDFQERLTTLKYGKNNKSLFVGTYEGLYYSNDFNYSNVSFNNLLLSLKSFKI